MKKLNDRTRVKNYMAKNPDAKPVEIAKALGVTATLVYSVRGQEKKRAVIEEEGVPTLKPAEDWMPKFGDNVNGLVLTDMGEGMARWVKPPKSDPVNHPDHYTMGGIETIDFIEAKQLNYHLGNVVKYITRAEHKGNQLQDLQKALWYLEREIKNVQA